MRDVCTSGIFAIFNEQQTCLLVGASWNLKARLLELANVTTSEQLSVTYELCPDRECPGRRTELDSELRPRPTTSLPAKKLPGLTLGDYPDSRNA